MNRPAVFAVLSVLSVKAGTPGFTMIAVATIAAIAPVCWTPITTVESLISAVRTISSSTYGVLAMFTIFVAKGLYVDVSNCGGSANLEIYVRAQSCSRFKF